MTVPTSISEFEDQIRSKIDPVRFPSVAFGVARGPETLLLGAEGMANKESGVQATTRTPYSLASVTKPMTSTALMLLAERGLIDLQAPVNDYLGAAKIQSRAGDASEATVWRVADHTAGLPLHYQFYYEDEPYRPIPRDESIRRYGKTFTAPGERHQYSNLGYGILDYLIERLSGKTYGEFMKSEVFEPLRMTGSSIGAPEDAAASYGPDGVPYPRYEFDHPGGSAAYSSVEDLLAFGRFHLGLCHNLIPRARLDQMHRATARTDNAGGYGFGWREADRLGARIVEHTGGMGGVNTILRLVPDQNLVIAVLVNGQSDVPFVAADDALAAFDPGFRERLKDERAQAKPAPAPDVIPSDWWGRYDGRVETHEGEVSVQLELRSGTDAVAVVSGKESKVEEVRLQNGRLSGVCDGDLGTADAGRRPYRLHLDLKLEQGHLQGAIVSITRIEGPDGGAPGKRLGNALAYWASLGKT